MESEKARSAAEGVGKTDELAVALSYFSGHWAAIRWSSDWGQKELVDTLDHAELLGWTFVTQMNLSDGLSLVFRRASDLGLHRRSF